MSAIIQRLSARYDIWEESAPIEVATEPIGEAMRRSVELAWLVASPLVVLVDWLRGLQEPENAPPEWQAIGQMGNWRLWSQTWMDSETFPDHLDLYGPAEEVYALARMRFSPAIPEWEARYFFEESFPTDEGLYLLSYNPVGEGMTLHLLPADGSEPEDIAQITAQPWEMEAAAGDARLLTTPTEEEETRIMIARRW